MRRLPLLVVGLAVAGFAAACVPQTPPPPPPPPPNPVCQSQAAPPAPTTPSAQVVLTQLNTLAGAITMATRSGDATLYVGTQSGHVYADIGLAPPVEVLDLSSVVNQSGGELGLLGMTFSSDGTKLYVHYSAIGSGNTTVDEFAVGTPAPVVATFGGVGSRRPVLTAPGLEGNHNGGSLLIGPDNMLYLAIGDGGGGNDDFPGYSSHGPGGNGQNINTLQGKILRIDPTDPAPPGGFGLGLSYTAPNDNPFVGPTAGADEVWSFGLRNPFRMSFDKTTGDLWIGDVGQSAREEVDFLAHGDATHPYGKSANFGWNRCEGKTAGPDGTPPSAAGGPAVVDPIFDMSHANGDCAIIGGYVYRGSAVAALGNDYLYTDNCNGKIRALTRSGMTVTNRDLGVSVSSPSSFGQDNNGELYVLSLSGGLYRIDHL
jgi:glucose/arabinose dehydrogenase